jgi:hypothetical protein
MRSALVVIAAAAVVLLCFGAGARWRFWWAFAAVAYGVGILAG